MSPVITSVLINVAVFIQIVVLLFRVVIFETADITIHPFGTVIVLFGRVFTKIILVSAVVWIVNVVEVFVVVDVLNWPKTEVIFILFTTITLLTHPI